MTRRAPANRERRNFAAGVALILTALALGSACGGSGANSTPTALPTATAADSGRTATRVAGDQATEAAAISRLQLFLATWIAQGQVAAAPMLVPNERIPAGAPELTLLSATVIDHSIYKWGSEHSFTLHVTMDMHWPGGDGAAWGGHNARFVAFNGEPGSWTMSFSTGPPLR